MRFAELFLTEMVHVQTVIDFVHNYKDITLVAYWPKSSAVFRFKFIIFLRPSRPSEVIFMCKFPKEQRIDINVSSVCCHCGNSFIEDNIHIQ